DDNTSYCIENIQNMELVNQLYGINVIAMLSSTRLEGGAKYYKIGYYPMELPDEISSPVLEELGEQDMSDPATLTDFLDYCAVNFPASHSVLIIDDHGEGWRGSCLDEVNGGGGLLTIPEMKNAILQSNRARTDMIVFHASGMSMVEVCSGLQGCADYLLAGQFETPMEAVLGGDFWLSWLRSNLEATPLEVSQQITQLILDASGAKGKTIQVSLIELSSMEVVNNQIEIFGQKLATENNGYWDEIRHAWNETHAITYDHPTSVDIRIFAENILLEPNLSQIASLNAAAEDVIQSIDEAVLLSLVYFNYTDPAVPRGGLNIYFPYHITQFDSLDYAALESAQSEWLSFLSSFLSHRDNPIDCNDPVPITLGSPVTQFRFDDEYPQHWFQITLETGTYRFTLCDFPVGADYDLYSYRTCNDFPNNPAACTSDMEGCEDFTCQIQNTTELKILIHAYEGPMGSYTLLIQSVSDSVSVPPLSSIK
ncbi:hypothetical protein KKB28_04685, partial [bacterium]|nr:hypothetical protein [bacterium]